MFNYPAGQTPGRTFQTSTKAKKKNNNYASRGMSLEDKLNQSNEYYLHKDLAVIHKKPTPIQVVKVNYPRRSAARITEAYYRNASTTDYNGVYKNLYIDFEAKETTNKTSFPLSNLPEHQRVHMRRCLKHGGLSFLIVSFKLHQEVYLLPFQKVDDFLQSTDKQSLTYQWIKEQGYQCQVGLFPLIDYLPAIDAYLNDKII